MDPSEKATLRHHMLAKREHTAPKTRLEASGSLALHYADHPILAPLNPIAGYHAMRGEIELLPLFGRARQRRHTLCLPRIDPKTNMLTFHRWSPGDPLEEGPFGTKAPPATAPACKPALIFVPLLAFDERGYRLGYGGGYYDRTLAALRTEPSPPLAIGVAFSSQELPALPAEPHDEPLDGILTDMGVSFFNEHWQSLP